VAGFTALVTVNVKLPPVAVLVIASAVQFVRGSKRFVFVSTVKTPPVIQLATLKTRFVPARLKLLMTGAGSGMV